MKFSHLSDIQSKHAIKTHKLVNYRSVKRVWLKGHLITYVLSIGEKNVIRNTCEQWNKNNSKEELLLVLA